MVVGVVKVLNFSDKIPGFLKTMELCLKFRVTFSFTSLVLTNYEKNKSLGPSFILTTRATLIG